MNSTKGNVHDVFGQAARLFQNAIEAGVRVQEESAKSFSDMMGRLAAPVDWQQRTQATLDQAMGAAQQNWQEALRVMNDNAKLSFELLEKAFNSRQTEGVEDGATKVRELWETAMGGLRRNTEVLVQANSRLLESWKEVAKTFASAGEAKESK